MEEDEEVAFYLSPAGKDSIAELTPSELSMWLAKRGFSLIHCSILEGKFFSYSLFMFKTQWINWRPKADFISRLNFAIPGKRDV